MVSVDVLLDLSQCEKRINCTKWLSVLAKNVGHRAPELIRFIGNCMSIDSFHVCASSCTEKALTNVFALLAYSQKFANNAGIDYILQVY